ncbi:MAG TPA: POTRA domain-containing protein, partial [Steroidobacteraceae bacterium]|nr:POTRA domain-containing protein [Steroidobacteraceae bacterium]
MAIGVLHYPLMAYSGEPPETPADPSHTNAQTRGAPSASESSAAPAVAQAAPPGPATSTSPPAGAPASTAAPPAAAQPAAAPASPGFDLLEFQVEGNTLLQPIDIERAVTPYLGEHRSIKDIEAARTRLEKTYHDRGYKTVLVNIPEQRIAAGVVRLRVTEAAVGKLHVAGSQYHSLEAIREKMPQLSEGTVPDFAEVQKELGTVNRSADLKVTPVLKASDTPGRVDVDLMVKDKLPLHATVEVDNRYSANTSHLRTIGELRYDNLFQSGQSLGIQYQVAPTHPDDARIWSFSYVIPTANSFVWALYAVHSDSNIAAVGDLSVIGKGNIFGLRFIEPLPTS